MRRAKNQRDDDRHRSKWTSREAERRWLDAVAYGAGGLAIVLVAAIVIAIVVEELWIVLAALAVVALVAFAVMSLVNGDWWWN